MQIWRGLFIGLLSLTILLAWEIVPDIRIDTNLADVTPETLNDPQTQDAIHKLQASIQQRIILLLQSADENEVFDAADYLASQLDKIDGITVLEDNDALAEKLISSLSKYRFSLLSETQRQNLSKLNAGEIAEKAAQNLYKSNQSPQVFSFDQDPMAWHSETFLSLLGSSGSGVTNNITKEGYAVSISMNINRGAMDMGTQEILLKQLEQLINKTKNDFEVVIDKSGVFFFAADAAKNAKSDISLISIGSTIGVVLLLLVAFGTLRSLALPIASVALGVCFAFVITHSLYGAVHILTIVFGASLIGIVIDYSLHYFYHQSALENNSKSPLHRALLMSLITSLIGYAALSFSELEALKKVAVFSCCGLVMAWLSVICLGEVATRKPIVTNKNILPILTNGLSKLVAQFTPLVWFCSVSLVIITAGFIVIFNNPFSDDPRIFFKPSTELLASEGRVSAIVNDYEPGQYLVIKGQGHTQIYARYEQLILAIKRYPELNTSDLHSVLAWVPSPQQQQTNYLAQAKLYGTNSAIDIFAKSIISTNNVAQAIKAEYQSAKNRSLSPKEIIDSFGESLPPFWVSNIDREGNENIVAFVLINKGVNAKQLSKVVTSIEEVEYINTLERTKVALSEQRQSATQLLLFAYLLIAVLVVLRYRTISALWLVVIPVCASAGVVLACSAMSISLNLFHIMALFLVLGFGMDYTIFTKEMSGQSPQQRSLTLNAILLSAMTSVLSFGLLTISSIPVVSSFGLTLLLGNLFNLIGVFVAAQILADKH